MEIPHFTPEQANQLPDKPGVYKFFDKNKKLIYVGKAKSIKKRVYSYFNNTGKDRKTRKMVSEITTMEITLVNSEFDALLLENNLIKNNQPKYNILLKDDKTFPYILVTDERFPRIYSTRQVDREKGTYFGPYTSVRAMNTVLELIRNLYFIRTCKFNLSEENIKAGKFKICLEYHIGKCKGPCEDLQAEEEYNRDVEQAINVLKGNINLVTKYFKDNMSMAAEKLEFEKAQYYKDKLDLLEKFQSRSVVVNQKLTDTEVFTIVSDQKYAYVNFMKIKDGAIVFSNTAEVKKQLNESDDEILSLIVVELRNRYGSGTGEILSNIELPETLGKIIVPKIGDKKKLVDLSIKNAIYYKKERQIRAAEKLPREERILKTIQQDLRMQEMPKRIECFDNSNLGGSNPVASMVCFINAKPAKSEYRKFNIKTVTGPDDFASMNEVVYRRYKRLVEEHEALPQLIVIDGGKGQLNAASQALKDVGIYGKVTIIGIAKKLEEIYFPEDPFPIHINKQSESLKVLQHIRNEAHRFAITFHRQKRSKATFTTQLENIKGIGKATADKLLSHYRSLKKIKEADTNELEKLIGKDRAAKLQQALQEN
ncbi:MAG: excinuclease ABC subunit UvrC [Cyclobacteriaceae bacterium]